MSKEIEKILPVGQPRLVVLLPCPFCDEATGKPYVALYDEDTPNRRPWGFVVRCPLCEAQGPRFGTCEEAEEAWNTRRKPMPEEIPSSGLPQPRPALQFTNDEKACIAHALYHLRANKIADDNHPHTGWYCGKRGQFVERHKKALIVLEGFLSPNNTNQQP